MKTWIDLPPVWLALFLAFTWAVGQVVPVRLFGGLGAFLGAALVAAGLFLMAWAAAVMMLARTTVIPHRDPNALVTGGPFRLSRNPIYLADATILTGAALWWDAVPALLLVPVFMSLISQRFIRAEEDRLARAFGPAWEVWALKTRRWL